MARTIVASFDGLKRNLEITGLQESSVSGRQQSVRAVLDAGLTVVGSFLTGSYSRQTMIAPLSEADVDIFVVLNSKYYHNYNGQNGSQAGLLDLVKRTLRSTYTRTPDISRNGQAVTIRFDDFTVDVVPAFNRQGGGFLIPNSRSQSWISTDPKKHVELISTANKTHAGDFIPLVKMIKGWNRSSGRYFNSFHLEVMMLRVLEGIRITDYSSGARFFFDKARALIPLKCPDPAGYGSDVGAYIGTQTQIEEATAKLQLAYERAVRAEDFARRGNIIDAVEMWRKVFGDYFPAYG